MKYEFSVSSKVWNYVFYLWIRQNFLKDFVRETNSTSLEPSTFHVQFQRSYISVYLYCDLFCRHLIICAQFLKEKRMCLQCILLILSVKSLQLAVPTSHPISYPIQRQNSSLLVINNAVINSDISAGIQGSSFY